MVRSAAVVRGSTSTFSDTKNHRATDVLFKKLVPIFAVGVSEITHLGAYNKECERETEMMNVRRNVFKMSRQIPAEDVKDLFSCPRCISNLVLFGEQNIYFFYEYMYILVPISLIVLLFILV